MANALSMNLNPPVSLGDHRPFIVDDRTVLHYAMNLENYANAIRYTSGSFTMHTMDKTLMLMCSCNLEDLPRLLEKDDSPYADRCFSSEHVTNLLIKHRLETCKTFMVGGSRLLEVSTFRRFPDV